MNALEKGVYVFGAVAVIALLVLLLPPDLTGSLSVMCPEGFTFVDTYCVQDECIGGSLKCFVEGSFIRVPDCVCVHYMDKFLCGIKGSQETAVKSPNCTRRGQLDSVCGYYNSSSGMCVLV